MNIRTLTNPIAPIESVRAGDVHEVKTQVSSEDRDANGRREQEEPSQDPLNEEEMKKALEYLENLSGLKANGLLIEVEEANSIRVFLIKDHLGQVIRRIAEWEMRALILDKDKTTGQIFDKSA